MSKTRKVFGFYPERLRIDAGPIRVEPLPQLHEVAGRALSGDGVESGWIYAPAQEVRDLNPDFESVVLTGADEGALQVAAELVAVLECKAFSPETDSR